MSRIVRVEVTLVDLPSIRPHVLSVATMTGQTLGLVEIHCADGLVGVGEATTIAGLAYSDESPEGVKTTIDAYFAPLLVGADSDEPASLLARIDRMIVGNHFAKSAVETALLDLRGQRCGLPISELLGGRVRSAVPVLWTLASGDTARDIDEAESMLAQGRHNAFKLKIGKRGVDADVAHVAAIKAALGDRASVRVDVNMAWDEASARRALPMLASVGCELVEQPISKHNIAGMARLTAASPIAVMADEMLHGPHSAFVAAKRRAADVFAIKIEQSGGLFAAKRVEAIAEAADIGVYGGTMLEGGVGTLASAHLCATFTALPFGTELFGPLLLTEDILEEPPVYREFALQVPTGPGLGARLDRDKVAFFRRDSVRRRSASIPSTREA
ncbi:MAG: muconate cycloisomerase family protein [Caulobacteraceae bacterium]